MEAWFSLIGFVLGSLITVIIFRIERKDRLKISSQECKDKFKLVAIEKRLEAHQQALAYWYKMIKYVHKKNTLEKIKILDEAKEFWYHNSLYLEKETRKRFLDCINIVSSYNDKLYSYKTSIIDDIKEKLKNEYMNDWNDLMKLPEIIQKEVELEPIKPLEEFTPEGDKVKKMESK